MKVFEVETKENKYTYQLPTSLNEIDESYVLNATKSIEIADNYTLIALVAQETVGSIVLKAKRDSKDSNIPRYAIFIKCGNTDSQFIKKANCKDKLIVDNNTFKMVAQEIKVEGNSLSLYDFANKVNQDHYLFNRYSNNFGNEVCCFIDFAIIPNSEIKGIVTQEDGKKGTNKYVSIKAKEDNK